LETAHGIVPGIRLARGLPPGDSIIVNLSGRGDKDVQLVAELQKE
jgi:tryptophan synthase beta subunit